MHRAVPFLRRGAVTVLILLAFLSMPCAANDDTTMRSIVARSDIALGQPNVLPTQAMGLGNGRLGAAFWAADGLTLQLNRADTLPGRDSPGQVRFPDLRRLIADRGFHGRVNLYDGRLEEQGGGITLVAWVDVTADRVVVDLAGLDPAQRQHVQLSLWPPRVPEASVEEATGVLAEHWRDDKQPGGSGQAFGSLAAVRLVGRDAQARVLDARSVEVSALPSAEGRLRVIVSAPQYDGSRPAQEILRALDGRPVDPAATATWWHAFWARALPIRAESADGIARYAETLRTLFLFASAAHERGDLPGSQAGLADLFSSSRDDHFWDPAAYWFWNLRMQVAAHLAAGLPELDAPVFALYRRNLPTIRAWTRAHASGRPGICLPETMRFNGNGIEYESDRFRPFPIVTHSCDLGWSAQANARTLSSGAEVGLWVWRTWLQTHDRAFLEANYPLMADAARFLLAYQRPGADGLLHTAPSNAHETQMDVHDPATDLAAIHALYPAVIEAAHVLQRDARLAGQLQAALRRTPSLPVFPADAVAMPSPAARPGDRVLAASYDPAAPYRNGENIGLEAVWPYALIGRDDPRFPLVQRTFALRPFVAAATWSYDPVQAARLGLGDDMARAIFQLVQLYQVYPNGMAALLAGPPHEFYLEQAGVTALALSEVLAIQDRDGLVRIAPAVPSGWTMDGAVALQDGWIADVTTVRGRLTAFALHGGRNGQLRIATPWPHDRRVQLWQDGKPLASIAGDRFEIAVAADHTYRVTPLDDAGAATAAFAPDAAPTVKTLGRASIGLGPPCCAPPPDYDPRRDMPAAQ